jgi:23S rRNA pseudouridine2605 synthase
MMPPSATAPETRRLSELLGPVPPPLVWYRATIRQGWKRQIRRMFAAIGMPVERLVRVRIGPVRLERLPSGAVRPLSAQEIRGLGAGHLAEREDVPPTTPARRHRDPPVS